MQAEREILQRKPKLIFDRLDFSSVGPKFPFDQDPEAAIHNRSAIPLPPSPTGHFQNNYINRFLPSFPDEGERRDGVAVAIMREICFPRQNLKAALANNPRLANLLAQSAHPDMQNAGDEQRRELFLRGIAIACAITSQEIRIRGAVLKKLYIRAHKNLADTVGVLLAVNLGTRLGEIASRQLLGVPGAGPVSFSVDGIVRRLSSQYADFKIFHQALDAHNPMLGNIVEIGNGSDPNPPAAATMPRRETKKPDH